MAENPYISRITLPSGTTYDLHDDGARAMIAGGMQHIVAWAGDSVPDISKIPAGVTVVYEGTTYTGSMEPSIDLAGKFYLVKSQTQKGSTLDFYDEYIIVIDEGISPTYR